MTEQVLNPHLHDQVPHVISEHSQKGPDGEMVGRRWGCRVLMWALPCASLHPTPHLIRHLSAPFPEAEVLPEASAKAFPCHLHTAPLQTDLPTPRL